MIVIRADEGLSSRDVFKTFIRGQLLLLLSFRRNQVQRRNHLHCLGRSGVLQHQVSELLSLFRFDQHHPVLLVLLVLVILNAEVVSVTGCSA